MKLLAIDSSAKSASVAVTEDERLLSECFVNTSLTHSCTLLPMINNSLIQADLKTEDIDCIAVNSGPGSFTGIRIGVAAAKGIAFPYSLKCASVSTLESIAYNFLDENCIVCSVMDARCNQVYSANFRIESGKVSRLSDDRAISIDDLKKELSALNEAVFIAGDGADICFEKMKELKHVKISSENRKYQRAYGVALAAINKNIYCNADELVPVYLRPPQAERELKLKKENEK